MTFDFPEGADRPRKIITTVDDPDFDAKIQAAILKQMEAGENSGEAGQSHYHQ